MFSAKAVSTANNFKTFTIAYSVSTLVVSLVLIRCAVLLCKKPKHNWAIHTTLYRVCCMEYTWLFVNAHFFAVLCIVHSKCIFFYYFLYLNNFIARNQHCFRETYQNIHTFFSFTHFDSMKPIQLLKTHEKNVCKCCIIFQQYIQYNDTTASVN